MQFYNTYSGRTKFIGADENEIFEVRFCSMPAAYKRRITRKKGERKMEFEMFHNPIGAFRRKSDYSYVKARKTMRWLDEKN